MAIDQDALEQRITDRLKTLLGTKPDSDNPLHTAELKKTPLRDQYYYPDTDSRWTFHGHISGKAYREAKFLEELLHRLDTSLVDGPADAPATAARSD